MIRIVLPLKRDPSAFRDITVEDVEDGRILGQLARLVSALKQSEPEQWPSLGEYLQKYFVAGQLFEAMYRNHDEIMGYVEALTALIDSHDESRPEEFAQRIEELIENDMEGGFFKEKKEEYVEGLQQLLNRSI